jgi:hypothetical protein
MVKISASLARFQNEFTDIKKDSSNPFFKSKYLSLSAILQTIKRELFNYGLTFTQLCGADEHGKYVETILIHTSGELLKSKVYLLIDKNNMQGLGSAITYAKRYGIVAILGLDADFDDDGNLSVKQKNDHTEKINNLKKLIGIKVKSIVTLDQTFSFGKIMQKDEFEKCLNAMELESILTELVEIEKGLKNDSNSNS